MTSIRLIEKLARRVDRDPPSWPSGKADYAFGSHRPAGIRIAGRSTQGVIVFDTAADEHVVSVEHIGEEAENGNGNGNGG
jgi:hypothetical protein